MIVYSLLCLCPYYYPVPLLLSKLLFWQCLQNIPLSPVPLPVHMYCYRLFLNHGYGYPDGLEKSLEGGGEERRGLNKIVEELKKLEGEG